MTTTLPQYWPKSCKPHREWLAIGGHRVFLKSSGGDVDGSLDVFIDLTGSGFYDRRIPHELHHLFPNRIILMPWEIRDGSVCAELPGMVVTMLEAEYSVGWGCIGGHGRTGWLAAKVLQLLTGCTGDEAVDYVRGNYCNDAVESQKQLDDLGSTKKEVKWWNDSVVTRRWNIENKCWEDELEAMTAQEIAEIEETIAGDVKAEKLLFETDEEYQERKRYFGYTSPHWGDY